MKTGNFGRWERRITRLPERDYWSVDLRAWELIRRWNSSGYQMGDGYPTGRWECPKKLLPEVYLSCMALPPPDLQACLVSSVGPNHDPCTTAKLLGYSKATRTTVGIICIGYKLCFRLMRTVCVHVLFVLKECQKDCWGKWKCGWLPLTDLAMD